MSLSEDKILFDRIKNGRDTDAYDKLFRRWYPSLVAYACNFVDDPDAENAVQDVMLTLWEKASGINIKESVSSYLFTCVKFKCLNLIGRGQVKEKVVSAIRMSIMDSTMDTDFYTIKELSVKLQSALCELSDVQRQAFEMNRFDNKTYEEIAREQGVSVKTVEYRISQAIKKLRETLKDYLPLLALLLAIPH